MVKEAQKNSVRNLENLYSIIVGLGLSIAIFNLIDTTQEILPIKLELVPFFLSYLFTLIPFYHGALRHLDLTYVEERGQQVRAGALIVDFTALFFEACLLLALAVMLPSPLFFAWGLVILLAFDTIWAFIAHLAFTQDKKNKAELKWASINFFTSVLLGVVLLFMNISPQATGANPLKLQVLVIGVCSVRTVLDYILCWNFYYPSSK